MSADVAFALCISWPAVSAENHCCDNTTQSRSVRQTLGEDLRQQRVPPALSKRSDRVPVPRLVQQVSKAGPLGTSSHGHRIGLGRRQPPDATSVPALGLGALCQLLNSLFPAQCSGFLFKSQPPFLRTWLYLKTLPLKRYGRQDGPPGWVLSQHDREPF